MKMENVPILNNGDLLDKLLSFIKGLIKIHNIKSNIKLDFRVKCAC